MSEDSKARAKRVHGNLHFYHPESEKCIAFIVTQIDEAVKEAVKPLTLDEAKAHFKDGFAAARIRAMGAGDD